MICLPNPEADDTNFAINSNEIKLSGCPFRYCLFKLQNYLGQILPQPSIEQSAHAQTRCPLCSSGYCIKMERDAASKSQFCSDEIVAGAGLIKLRNMLYYASFFTNEPYKTTTKATSYVEQVS
jgi:hypothetical protein